MNFSRYLMVPLLGGFFMLWSAPLYGQDLTVVEKNGPSVRLVCSEKQQRKTVKYLRDYLVERVPSVRYRMLDRYTPEASGTQIILATVEGLEKLEKLDLQTDFLIDAHSDAFILEARQQKNQTVLYLVGKTSAGLRFAVYRLTNKLINTGNGLLIPAGREEQSPFINTRLICLAPTARRQMPTDSPLADANLELWKEKRLHKYPEVFGQFGFSGIQVTLIPGYGSIRGEYLDKARKAVKTLARGAKDRDMFVSLDQWGDCPWAEGKALCWEVPEEREKLQSFFQDLADRYGPLVDHVYIHVGDPGGASHGGCNMFVTPQKITTAVRTMFAKYNPNVQATMSTWANTYFWKHCPHPVDLSNYWPVFTQSTKDMEFGQEIPEGASFMDDTWMPQDIGIALHRTYNDEQADEVVKAGRPLDIWGWYIGDMEMQNNLTVNCTTVDDFYKDLPAEAGECIRWQTIELCFHGWPQIINSYVGARKMWNPKRSLEDIMREFCTAAFGPDNADAMYELYRVCEVGWDYDVWGKPYEYLPFHGQLGTQEVNRRLGKALQMAETVEIPESFTPNFAFPVPVQRYVDMLKARCRLTLALSEARYEVFQARANGQKEGLSEQEIKNKVQKIKTKALENLPELTIDPLYRQDETTINPAFKLKSFAEMIKEL